MHSIREDIDVFRGQLRDGSIQKAYYALLLYMTGLRTYFKKKYPSYALSGLYQGYMDMTYFALFPPPLKQRDPEDRNCLQLLKHSDSKRGWQEAIGKVQRQCWELFEGQPMD